LMDAQQDKSSPRYHAWLTPDEFGEQFGPSDADLLAVTDWLSGQGFQNVQVAAGRTVIEFGGNAGQVRRAFGTQIQNYAVHGTDLPERRKFPGRFQYRERFCKHPRLHSAAKHHDYGYCWTIANGGRECYSSFDYAKFGHL